MDKRRRGKAKAKTKAKAKSKTDGVNNQTTLPIEFRDKTLYLCGVEMDLSFASRIKIHAIDLVELFTSSSSSSSSRPSKCRVVSFLGPKDLRAGFDIKWSPGHLQSPAWPMLAQADADGCVKIYSLHSDGPEMRGNCLNEVYEKHISQSMCLCIDWNPSATSMVVGLSDGSVSIVSLHEAQLNVLQEWKAHNFEVWAASFDIQQPMLVYTGSDDCKFSCWDLRDDPCNSVFEDTKVHKMGICCIAKSPFDPNIVLTGSYDERLRVWDVRSTSKPVSESSICLGGGVWRIKHHPSVQGLVLTACMHNGFAIVKFEGDGVEVVETYDKHGSLAYGVDWQRGDCNAVASCSFYDRLLRVWKPEGGVFSEK